MSNETLQRPTDTAVSDNQSEKPISLVVPRVDGESFASACARAQIQPSFQAGLTIDQWTTAPFPEPDINKLVGQLQMQAKAVQEGDLSRPEAMLTTQAHVLDTIFNHLARRARENMLGEGAFLTAAEMYLRLAFRAQSQCRATLETLAEIKYPNSPTFIRQQNLAQNQQVNNGMAGVTPTQVRARTRKNKNTPSKLLTGDKHARLDSGKTKEAIGAYSNLAAVETIHRAGQSTRESQVIAKRVQGRETAVAEATSKGAQGDLAKFGRSR